MYTTSDSYKKTLLTSAHEYFQMSFKVLVSNLLSSSTPLGNKNNTPRLLPRTNLLIYLLAAIDLIEKPDCFLFRRKKYSYFKKTKQSQNRVSKKV